MAKKRVDLSGSFGAQIFDELKKRKAFGVSLSKPEILIKSDEARVWEKNGWLGDDGICKFPDDVKAMPTGFIAPMLPAAFWTGVTEERIREAVESGLIKFVDGNGVARTKDEYIRVYQNYPDPELVLRLTGRFPPGEVKRFIRLGRYG